jgi:Zn(2)-Cys(6) binuclear cluster domain-containing protein
MFALQTHHLLQFIKLTSSTSSKSPGSVQLGSNTPIYSAYIDIAVRFPRQRSIKLKLQNGRCESTESVSPIYITMGDSRDGDQRKDIRSPGQLQQSRRFACDRCRMQKLRCERDIWSSPLMSCKRCRKRNLTCTISPRTDRASIRRSRRRSSSKIVTAVRADDPEHSTDDTNLPSGKIIDQWPNTPLPDFENGHGFWRNAEQALPPISIPINHFPPTCGYQPVRNVEGFGPVMLSGLMTPPASASDVGREMESRYQSSTSLLSNSQGNKNVCYVRQRLERDYINYHETGTSKKSIYQL